MKRKNFLLWHKLVLWLSLSMVLLGVGLMGANYFFMQRASQDIGVKGSELLAQQAELYLAATVAGQADTIDLQLEQVRMAAEMGAASLAYELTLFNTPLHSHLKQLFSKSGSNVTTVYYHSLDGTTRVYPRELAIQQDRLQKSLNLAAFFLDFKDQRHLSVKWSPVHTNPFSVSYDRVVDAVAPVQVNGKLRGYLGISISVRRLVTQFNHRQAIRGSYTFLINSEQHLLGAPPHGLQELRPKGQKNVREEIIDLSGHENGNLDKILSRMALGNSAVEPVSIQEWDKYIAYRPMRKHGWSIGVSAPLHLATIASGVMKEIIADRKREAMTSMVFIALLLLFLTVIATIGITRRLIAPLKEMAKAADQIAHGQLNHTIHVDSDDEIGVLAGSFNTMASRLSTQVSDLQRQQQSLSESEARYRRLFESSPVSLWAIDLSDLRQGLKELKSQEGENFAHFLSTNQGEVSRLGRRMKVVDVNHATLKLYGAPDKTAFFDYLPDLFETVMIQKPFTQELIAMADNRFIELEYNSVTLDGRELTVVTKSSIAPGFETSWSQVFVSVHDITKRVHAEKEKTDLESQLRQSQKLEAIGTLAGGIAHDFNNILTAIMGYAELLLHSSQEGGKQRKYSENIFIAGQRAKDLVGQILSFSRPNNLGLEPVSVSQVAEEVCSLLKASLPSTIRITQEFNSPGVVLANPSQIHQVLMNICTNGAQAMGPDGGELMVRLLQASNKGSSTKGREHDQYLLLQIQDSGCGMAPEVIDRIFDPFYTTKGPQQGTGMGLAVAHGIVRSCGGFMQVTSKLNEGTVFDVYLPAAGGQPANILSEKTVVSKLGRGEKILFVDDEAVLVDLAEQMLVDLGYYPVAHVSPQEALRQFREDPAVFYMVITDMTMPEMRGDRFAGEIKKLLPNMPILLSTGYSSSLSALLDPDVDVDKVLGPLGVDGLIKKPFTITELSAAIQSVIDKKVL